MTLPDKKPVGRPPERMTVTIRYQAALSQPPIIETAVWPKSWPLPTVGDRIIGKDGSGIVLRFSFDVEKAVLGIEVA